VATALFPRRLSRHLETIVPIYRSRRDTLCAALVREGANALHFSRPAGGLFLWATLAHDLLAEPLLEEALAEGVSFLPGAPFFPGGYGGERALRLNFAAHPKATIEEGMRRLGSALHRTARRARPGRREFEREEAREEAFV
jgi:DNA-binding transcriptional MocR family regulator